MTGNRDGLFIWYELMTGDPDAARAFYGPLAGWHIEEQPSGEADYRMISAAAGPVAGMLPITADMRSAGARPMWLGYIRVADVDAAVAAVQAAGGQVHMPPRDIDDVGRIAMVADPEGAPLYLMAPCMSGESNAFAPGTPGHFAWNEINTTNPVAARAFYATMFPSWSMDQAMDMGEGGEYRFIGLDGQQIGAMAGSMGQPSAWRYYIEVPSIDVAAAKVAERGGAIRMGPHAVPGDRFILIGADPEGAEFALVGDA